MTVVPIQTRELEELALAWPNRARALVIADDPSFVLAAETVNDIKALRREIDLTFDPIIAAQHKAHAEAIAQKKRHEAPLIEAEGIIKRTLSAYRDAQERKRQEEESRLREEARQLEEERILREAMEAEAEGDNAAAEEIIAQPVAPPPVFVAPATPKVSGVSFRETWTFRVEDVGALIAHCAAHPEDANLLTPNTTAIRAIVNARKGACKIPGIHAYSERTVAAGRR